jgi:hypothetical protein
MVPHLLFPTPTDVPARVVGGKRRIKFIRCGGHYDYPGNVLASLSQQDGLFKASCCLVISTEEPSLTFIYRTDSIIKTLMTYCVHTGLVSRWESTLGDSATSSNKSSLLAIGKLVSVRFPFYNLIPGCFHTAPSVHNYANHFYLGGIFLVDG